MKHKQKQSYGCGLYAVANACDLDGFITQDRLEKSKNGNIIGQLSKWLQEDGYQFYIDVLYYNHLGKKLPVSALSFKPTDKKDLLLPILLKVRYSDMGINHLVGGRIDKDGNLYLFDSLKDKMITTTLAKANKMYHNVCGLFLFMDVENGDYIVIDESL